MGEQKETVTILSRVVGPVTWQYDHLMKCPVMVMTLSEGQILKLTGPAVTRMWKLVEACGQVDSFSGPEFLDWVADRMVNVYGENAGADFVLTARRQAEKLRIALAALSEVTEKTLEG